MKTYLICFVFLFSCINIAIAQEDPWTADQLMKPEVLAQKINQNELDHIKLIHIGFEDMIEGSVDAGPASEADNLTRLKDLLKDVSKEDTIVLYCGCCPMDVCPNIRPAFEYVSNLGYKKLQLLKLETSIKADWLDYDYPVKE